MYMTNKLNFCCNLFSRCCCSVFAFRIKEGSCPWQGSRCNRQSAGSLTEILSRLPAAAPPHGEAKDCGVTLVYVMAVKEMLQMGTTGDCSHYN